MKLLIIGDGGREHALAWLASKSPVVDKFFYFGKNAGILSEPKCEPALPLAPDISGVVRFAEQQTIDLTIVGPEQPLADGIVDQFQKAGLPIFGPTQAAAQLESSKWFAKDLMVRRNVPTAMARRFTTVHLEEALNYLAANGAPVVIKTDGLCGGKGSIVCHDIKQAIEAIQSCLVKREFGPAGDTILIEEFLVGHPNLPRAELSILALVDIFGNFIMFPAAQDHKPVFDGDQGPNTGGMGAYAPVPWVNQEMMKIVGRTIFAPVIAEMKKRGTPFSGVLYAGLIWTMEGPKVVEFNVRFGDPELQPLAMILNTDLIPILKKIADGESIADIKLEWSKESAVCIVMAANGYPDPNVYVKGAEIIGDVFITPFCGKIFHAGTRRDGGKVITAGGRVFGVTASAYGSLSGAARRAYQLAEKISWTDANGHGPHYRKDIGQNVLAVL